MIKNKKLVKYYYTCKTCDLCNFPSNNKLCNSCNNSFSKLKKLEKKLKNTSCIFGSVFCSPYNDNYECVIHQDSSKNFPGLCDFKDYFYPIKLEEIKSRQQLLNIVINYEKKLNVYNCKINNYQKKYIRTIFYNYGPQIQYPLKLIATIYNKNLNLFPFESNKNFNYDSDSDMSIDYKYNLNENNFNISYKNAVIYNDCILKIQKWIKKKFNFKKKIFLKKIQKWIKNILKREYFSLNILYNRLFKLNNFNVINHLKFNFLIKNCKNLKCNICNKNFNFENKYLNNKSILYKKINFDDINIYITSCNKIYHKTCFYDNESNFSFDHKIDNFLNKLNENKIFNNIEYNNNEKKKIINDTFYFYKYYGFYQLDEYNYHLDQQELKLINNYLNLNISNTLYDKPFEVFKNIYFQLFNSNIKISKLKFIYFKNKNFNKICYKYNLPNEISNLIKSYIFYSDCKSCPICKKSFQNQLEKVIYDNYEVENCNIYISSCNCIFHKSCIYNFYNDNSYYCPKCKCFDSNNEILKSVKNDQYYKITKKFKYELNDEEINKISLKCIINEIDNYHINNF